MLNKDLKSSEKAVQDSVARLYEDVRYHLPASRRYYDWFFKKLFGLARPQGLILDNGCGNGILGEFLPNENNYNWRRRHDNNG